MRVAFVTLFFCVLLAPLTASARSPLCNQLPTWEKAEWNKKRSKALVAIASPNHTGLDAVAIPGEPITVRAQFSYGRTLKDLEQEKVDLFMGTGCTAMKHIGEAKTDEDGWTAFKFKAPKTEGVHTLKFRVQGDGSTIQSLLFVHKKDSKIALFDIDGTLTTSDSEVMKKIGKDYFKGLKKGKYTPKLVPYGPQLTKAYEAQGYKIVYATGRPYWLKNHTTKWLRDNGFALGFTVFTTKKKHIAPTKSGVGAFKSSAFKSLAKIFDIAVAHGNATTDIDAYLNAGISKAAIYIIGEHGGKEQTVAVAKDWEATLSTLKKSVP